MKLAIDLIEEDGGTQSREGVNAEKVREYSEILDQLPPVTVFYDGAKYWLADGFHRFAAAMNREAKTIEADVRQGTLRDAIFFSLSANAAHGIPRSTGDKRRAVERMLGDEEWRAWSDRKIAEACRVSHTFVASIRRPTSPASGNVATSTSGIRSHGGNVASVHATNTGSNPVREGGRVAPIPAPAAAPNDATDRLAADAEVALANARAMADAAWVHPRARLLLTTAIEDTARWCARRQRESAA